MSYFSEYADMDERDHIMADLRAEDDAERRYQAQLLAHPDCRDPDHPGCANCEGEDE
jgi:hypothetical protein